MKVSLALSLIFAVSFPITFLGCTRSSPVRQGEWSPYETSTADQGKVIEQLNGFITRRDHEIFHKEGVVTWRVQTIYDIPVEGSWAKESRTNRSGIQFISYKMFEPKDIPTLPPSFFKGSEEFKQAVEKVKEALPDRSRLLEMSPAFLPKAQSVIPIWKAVAISGGPGGKGPVTEFQIDAKDYLILKESPVGSSFQTYIPKLGALVYPDGPKRSSLKQVELYNVVQGPMLKSGKARVYSATGTNVNVDQSPLVFKPEDLKFTQVQVFFTLQKANDWFEKVMGWTWAGMLSVETNTGHPEKVNTAFYYSNRIRLGQGDGVTYENIPLDPTIVVHEASHSVIDRMTRLPFHGQGGSLNEALADFLTATQLSTPVMGEVALVQTGSQRNLENSKTWNEINGGLYNDSLVVSTLLWKLRKEIGAEKTLTLVTALMRDLTPEETLDSFRKKLLVQAGLLLTAKESEALYSSLTEARWPSQ